MSTTTTGDQPSHTRETAPCVKCTTEIPVEAKRCPECGFEPNVGILGGIFMWIAFSVGTLFALIAIVSTAMIFTGFPVMDALYVTGFTGFIAAVCFAVVRAGYRQSKQKATDQPKHETRESKSISESWEEGAERGERIAERINSIGPAVVHAVPAWTWSAGTVLGIGLSLSLWYTALQENETGMMIGIVGGGLLLFFSILADSLRLNKHHDDLHFRWWFYSVLAFIPLIGWLFGVGWLLRKRQKNQEYSLRISPC